MYMTESGLMLPRAEVSCEEMEEGMAAEGHGVSFVSYENTLKLITVMSS